MGSTDYVPDKPPKTPKGNVALGLAKATLAGFPVVGGTAAELMELLFRPALEARRDEWYESIARELHDLKEKVEDLSLEDLANDPSFTTTFVSATQIAIRTHQEEKREALRNAVANTALGNKPDDDMRAVFLSLVDRFTPSHLSLLKLLDDPKRFTDGANIDFSNKMMGSVAELIEKVFPEMVGRREFYDLLGSDLNAAGLMGTGSFHATITGSGMLQRRTSQLGREFLEFISEPKV